MSELDPLPEGYHARDQTMVEPDPPREGYASNGTLVGYRNDAMLKGSFPNSPMLTNDADKKLTDKKLTDLYRGMLATGVEKGYLFPEGVQFNYINAPNMGDVGPAGQAGGNGKPVGGQTEEGIAWPVPTPVNALGPAVGGTFGIGASPTDQRPYDFDGGVPKQKSINFGAGPSSPVNPSDSSADTADQDFTDLQLGKSNSLRIGSYTPSDDTGGS